MSEGVEVEVVLVVVAVVEILLLNRGPGTWYGEIMISKIAL
jgi:hypothetical protein